VIEGIVAALKYATDRLRDSGDTMPSDIVLDPADIGVTVGWLDVFSATIVDAFGNILARHQGEQS
jgi:hypothetical protein